MNSTKSRKGSEVKPPPSKATTKQPTSPVSPARSRAPTPPAKRRGTKPRDQAIPVQSHQCVQPVNPWDDAELTGWGEEEWADPEWEYFEDWQKDDLLTGRKGGIQQLQNQVEHDIGANLWRLSDEDIRAVKVEANPPRGWPSMSTMIQRGVLANIEAWLFCDEPLSRDVADHARLARAIWLDIKKATPGITGFGPIDLVNKRAATIIAAALDQYQRAAAILKRERLTPERAQYLLGLERGDFNTLAAIAKLERAFDELGRLVARKRFDLDIEEIARLRTQIARNWNEDIKGTRFLVRICEACGKPVRLKLQIANYCDDHCRAHAKDLRRAEARKNKRQGSG